MKKGKSWRRAALAWASLLLAAGALEAQMVADVRVNPGGYIGRTGSYTGLVGPVKAVMKKRHGQWVQILQFCLYELDAKGKKGPHHIWVSLPATQLNNIVPQEGGMLTVPGTLKPPYQVAVIDE